MRPYLSEFNKEQDLILFFTPEAEVLSHFVSQVVLAKNLENLGYKTAFTFCSGVFCRCPSMDCHGLAHDATLEEKQAICGSCVVRSISILQKFNLSWMSLKQVITPEMIEFAKDVVERAGQDIFHLTVDGFPFGQVGYGDYAIESKRWQPDKLDAYGLLACQNYVRSSVLSYLALRRVCRELPIRVIARFNDYANNMGALFAARSENIRCFTISVASHLGGTDRRRILLLPKLWAALQQDQIQIWPSWRNLPQAPETIEEIATDSIKRFQGASYFVYSPASSNGETNIREQLRLTPGKRCLVAFTSSPDEREFSKRLLQMSGESYQEDSQLFVDHVDWLQQLVDYVERSTEMELVVRVHPREGVNLRYPSISEHYKRLKQIFGDREYSNCRFVWPEDKVSSYDLLEIADLGLTSWSSIGIEMARLGIPVITAFRNMSFPDDTFHRWGGPTLNSYFQAIRSSLEEEATIENIVLAYRCYHLFQLSYGVLVDDQIPEPSFEGVPEITGLAREANRIASVLVDNQDNMDITRRELIALSERPLSYDLELSAVLKQIKRLIYFFLVGRECIREPQVVVSQAHLLDRQLDLNDLRVVRHGCDELEYHTFLGSGIRKSPLISRLLRIIEKSEINVSTAYSDIKTSVEAYYNR